MILYFRLLYFMSLIVIYFLLSASVPSCYIDVILTLSTTCWCIVKLRSGNICRVRICSNDSVDKNIASAIHIVLRQTPLQTRAAAHLCSSTTEPSPWMPRSRSGCCAARWWPDCCHWWDDGTLSFVGLLKCKEIWNQYLPFNPLLLMQMWQPSRPASLSQAGLTLWLECAVFPGSNPCRDVTENSQDFVQQSMISLIKLTYLIPISF